MTLICYFKRNNLSWFSGFIIFLLHRGNATSIALVPPERNLGDNHRAPSSSYLFLKFISLFLSALAPFQSMPKPSFVWATINRLLSWGLLYWDAVWSRKARVSSRGGNPSVTFRVPSRCPSYDLWGPVLSGPVPLWYFIFHLTVSVSLPLPHWMSFSFTSRSLFLTQSVCTCHSLHLESLPASPSIWPNFYLVFTLNFKG